MTTQFSPEDIERFIEAIEADEHLRARVERAILSDRMYELPDKLAQLTEIVAHFIEETEKRFDRLEADIDILKSDVGTLKSDVGTLKSDVGTLKGSDYERRCREYAPSILGGIRGGLRRIRVMRREALADLLDDLVDQGKLSQESRDDVLRADLVLTAKSKETGDDIYLVVEASVRTYPHDVSRAIARAEALRVGLGEKAVGVVITAYPIPEKIDTSGVDVVLYQYTEDAA
ncbi:MAG: hypothetical protein ACYDGY_02680 [Acidimicrobiales bacterium]